MQKKRTGANFKSIVKEEKIIEDLERAQLKKLGKEDRRLNRLEKEEEKLERLTKKELQELEELKQLEEEIKKSVKESPLKRITTKDMARGLVGSFFGIVAHFAFAKGVEFTEQPSFTMVRATILFIISIGIGFIFLYATGYREIKDMKLLSILPIRLIVIFGISMVSILAVLSIYGIINSHSTFQEIYKQVAAISPLAIIGAATADLIGKKND
ncbi:hypothetical protein HYX18_01825 [Candidatus Woesearchaeota archaeon]|nr:hypothetical protein [Candidatus Woesearchaeota archaeon]